MCKSNGFDSEFNSSSRHLPVDVSYYVSVLELACWFAHTDSGMLASSRWVWSLDLRARDGRTPELFKQIRKSAAALPRELTNMRTFMGVVPSRRRSVATHNRASAQSQLTGYILMLWTSWCIAQGVFYLIFKITMEIMFFSLIEPIFRWCFRLLTWLSQVVASTSCSALRDDITISTPELFGTDSGWKRDVRLVNYELVWIFYWLRYVSS